MSSDPTASPYQPTASPPGPPPPSSRSGAVTAVAVVNFTLGFLQLLCGGCVAFGGGALAGFASQMSQQDPDLDPQSAEMLERAAQIGGGLIIALGIAYLLLGVMLLVAGYGVMNRRSWGRVLTLVLGAIAGILAVLALASGEWFGGTANLAYAVFVYVILLNSRYAAEFS